MIIKFRGIWSYEIKGEVLCEESTLHNSLELTKALKECCN